MERKKRKQTPWSHTTVKIMFTQTAANCWLIALKSWQKKISARVKLCVSSRFIFFFYFCSADLDESKAPLPPLPRLLLLGNSQRKNMAVSHSTRLHVPVLSSCTQLELLPGDILKSSCKVQAEKPCRRLEWASTWPLDATWRWERKTCWWRSATKKKDTLMNKRRLAGSLTKSLLGACSPM